MAFKDDAQLNTDHVSRSGGGGSGMKIGGGIGGALLVLVVGVFFGQDGINMLNQVTGGSIISTDNVQNEAGVPLGDECKTGADANSKTDCNMVATSNSLDQFWGDYLQAETGVAYKAPQLKLFSNRVSTGCGNATSAVGPFYCPTDQVAYVDTTFFGNELKQLGAEGGQSVEQYVLAHEYGHHIQNQLGNLKYSQYDPAGADSGAVRVELQADCYAGIWASQASKEEDSIVQPMTEDEISRAVDAAEHIGDDHIQMTSQGHTDDSTYTHGTSAQRVAWYMQGYNTGDLQKCDTFAASDLDNPQA